jgi:glycolate oxidase
VADLAERLAEIVGAAHVVSGDAISDDYAHDEALTATPHLPDVVVKPASTDEVASIVRLATELGVAVTARGSGTGLSGACIARHGGILVHFERMAEVLEIDTENHMAVVQPGVTLEQLDALLAPLGLVYPVFPGENSASLGGNVATNAGGMRAVKYGVTRHQVLGVEAVLGTGEVIRTGGKLVKTTSGYDLTQLIIGSEGTLAVVTEAVLRLYPRLEHVATVLAPFGDIDGIAHAVPRIVASGIGPMVLEYIDLIAMAGFARAPGVHLGVPDDVQAQTAAYLVVVLEARTDARLEEDTAELADLLGALGALDVYVLPPGAGVALIAAREKAFWNAKAAGAHDIVDMVVPRAQIPEYLAAIGDLGQATGSLIVGCGHAGDGNVHLSIFQPDEAVRSQVLRDLFAKGKQLGGAVSGEHGIGSEKKTYYVELEDPAKLALMARIKTAFDPEGILNPGAIWDRAEPM